MLDHVLNDIGGEKWALFYVAPNNALEDGLTLLHTDNDVRRMYDLADENGSMDVYIVHELQPLSQFYFKNMVWQEEDAGMRCGSATPFKRRKLTKRVSITKTERGFEIIEKKRLVHKEWFHLL